MLNKDIEEIKPNDQTNMIILRHLTDKLQDYEFKLIKAAREWRDTFDSIQDALFIQDKDFKITRVNKAFCELIDMDPREVIGKKCYEICHIHTNCETLNNPPEDCAFKVICEVKKPIKKEVYIEKFGGWVEISVHPIKNGHVHSAIHIIRDINDKKLSEEGTLNAG